MIKAIIFDLGGVIINSKSLFAHILHLIQPEDEKKFWEDFNIEGIPLCKGEMTLLQFWRKIANKFESEVSEHVLKDVWLKNCETSVTINEEVQDIIHTLKKNYKLAILSNSIKEHAQFNESLGIYDPFDFVVLSHEVGMTKDEATLFLLVAELLGVTPQECVFIDDIQKFVDVAQSVGMQAIHFTDPEQLLIDLHALGVAV